MFKPNKYTVYYFSIISKAKLENRKKKQGIYYESHHIIPKSMGGDEEVLLTGKEHYICHLLLCKMLDGANKHKMINAMTKMAFSKSDNQKRYTAKSYSLVRKFIAEKNIETMKGVPKSEKAKMNMKGRSGTWKRSSANKDKISSIMKGKNLGELNGAKKPGVGNKISQSKLGRKRIYRPDGTYYYERI